MLHKSVNLRLGIITLLCITIVNASVSDYFRENDLDRYKKLLESNLKEADVNTVYFSLIGLKAVDTAIVDVNTPCNTIKTALNLPQIPTIETLYRISESLRLLSSCSAKLSDKHLKLVNDGLDSAKNSSQIHYATSILKNSNQAIKNSAKIAQNLQTILKSDDSVVSLTNAFLAAVNLQNDGKFTLDRIEDCIVQADEIDGKLLQFEGGLTVTSAALKAIQDVSKANNKPNPLTKEQAEKFVNYLLTRRSVQTPRGVSALLIAARVFVEEKSIAPASVLVYKVAPAVVTVKVCDLFGKQLGIADDAVTLESITDEKNGQSLLAKQKLTKNPCKCGCLYDLALPKEKVPAGNYKLKLTVAGVHKADVAFTAIAKVKFSPLDIGIIDSDLSAAGGKLQKLEYPNKLKEVLEADSQQNLLIKFFVIDIQSKAALRVQQSFVRLSNTVTKREIVFVPEIEGANGYKLSLDIASKIHELATSSESSTYDIDVVIGDSIVSEALQWRLGQINIRLSLKESDIQAAATTSSTKPRTISGGRSRGPLPEIIHQFRVAEKRPPQVVSIAFTGLALAPVLLLLVLWTQLGALNIKGFGLNAIVYHLSLLSIFLLYLLFWLKLDMFQTSKYLTIIGAVTFFFGNRTLRALASTQSEDLKKKNK